MSEAESIRGREASLNGRGRVPPADRVPVTPRAHLRAATRPDHEAVDRIFSQFDLARMDGYRSLLVAQASAHLAMEDALGRAGAARLLDDWPGRRRADLLRADLADLGAPTAPPVVPPGFAGESEIFGGLYVLEGSRLGGALLSSRVPPGAPARFLTAPQATGAWRKLVGLLDLRLACPSALEAAVRSARACFECFALAGRQELETVLG